MTASDREAAEQDTLAMAYRNAARQAIDTSGNHFTMTIDGQTFTKRADAAAVLQQFLIAAFRQTHGADTSLLVGHLAGFDVFARVTRDAFGSGISLSLDGIPRNTPGTTLAELREAPPLGLLTRVENLAGDLESRARAAADRAEQARRDSARASGRIGQSFEHNDRIASLRVRLAEIDKELAPPEEADTPPSPHARAPGAQDVARAVGEALARKRRWALTAANSTAPTGARAQSGPDLSI